MNNGQWKCNTNQTREKCTQKSLGKTSFGVYNICIEQEEEASYADNTQANEQITEEKWL